jgi:predicted SPOUT superfamily RNA methylase MTH1
MVAETISRDDTGSYWGYSVETKPFRDAFSDPRFGVKIATSRLGDPLDMKVDALKSSIRGRRGVKLLFGSPSTGLFEMAGSELRSWADFVLNLFPDQHVETVRTEEAIFAGLELLNVIMAGKA